MANKLKTEITVEKKTIGGFFMPRAGVDSLQKRQMAFAIPAGRFYFKEVVNHAVR